MRGVCGMSVFVLRAFLDVVVSVSDYLSAPPVSSRGVYFLIPVHTASELYAPKSYIVIVLRISFEPFSSDSRPRTGIEHDCFFQAFLVRVSILCSPYR